MEKDYITKQIEEFSKEFRQQEPILQQNRILYWTLVILVISSIVDIVLRISGK